MNEKILIQSERYDVARLVKRILCTALVLTLAIWAIVSIFLVIAELGDDWYDSCQTTYQEHQEKGYCPNNVVWKNGKWVDQGTCYQCEQIMDHPTKTNYLLLHRVPWSGLVSAIFCVMVPLSIIGVLVYFWLRSYELTVTDKRVYGKLAWGKRIDLPVDSVSAISYLRGWRGVSVSTASGRISFRVMKNAAKIYSVINQLLIDRQNDKGTGTVVQNSDSADQLKKYKELLDAGVITQEEFDAKKKQILDL